MQLSFLKRQEPLLFRRCWFVVSLIVFEVDAHRRSFIALDKSVLYSSLRTTSEDLTSKTALSQKRKTIPAKWFGVFRQSESTYDVDGEDRGPGSYEPSLDSRITNPILPSSSWAFGVPTEWFQESDSGGSLRAWQTSYPKVTEVRHATELAAVRHLHGHRPMAEDLPEGKVASIFDQKINKGAAWFDSSVAQYDTFGRAMLPSKRSRKRYVDWEDRRRNVTIECGPPGCVANASMTLFSDQTEEHKLCQLSIALHPTDFESDFSDEKIEGISVNGVAVTASCNPVGRGCDAEAKGRLEPCITDFPLTTLLGKDGVINVSAKLSPMVDECPINGKLLSGIAIVSCLVRPRGEAYPVTTTNEDDEEEADIARPDTSYKALLQCSTPGCIANSAIIFDRFALHKVCKMAIRIWQTDFDGDSESVEEVEWVTVNGANLTEHKSPGKNPCKSNTTRDMFLLVDEQDVDITSGRLDISVKISGMVDECGHGGFLLDAEAEVNCTGAPEPDATEADAPATTTRAITTTTAITTTAATSVPTASTTSTTPATTTTTTTTITPTTTDADPEAPALVRTTLIPAKRRQPSHGD